MNRDQTVNNEPSAEDTAKVTSDVHLPGRIVGVVVRAFNANRGFVFLKDEAGTEYFSHNSGWPTLGAFEQAMDGDVVSFKATRTTKGLRAHSIEAATEAEVRSAMAWVEGRGNR